MFKNMGGNIRGGNFLGRNFQGGSLMGDNFPDGSFPDTEWSYVIEVLTEAWPSVQKYFLKVWCFNCLFHFYQSLQNNTKI